MLIRHCPRCRSDFQPHITACLDCGGETVERDDEDEDDLPPAPPAPEPEEEDEDDLDDEDEDDQTEPAIPADAEVVLVRAATYNWIADLADALAERQIPARIQKNPTNEAYGLFVRVEDAEAAATVDREVYLAGLREELPEMREGACPACGTDISAGDLECSECGLILAVEEETEELETESP